MFCNYVHVTCIFLCGGILLTFFGIMSLVIPSLELGFSGTKLTITGLLVILLGCAVLLREHFLKQISKTGSFTLADSTAV